MSKYNIEINLQVNKAVLSSDKLKTSLSGIEAELAKISASTAKVAVNTTKSMTTSKTSVDKNTEALKKMNKEMTSMKSNLGGLSSLLGAAFGLAGLNSLKNYSDTYTEMTNKIKALSQAGTDYVDVENKLFEVSQRSRIGIAEAAQLYGRLSLAQKNLGASQAQLIRFTESVGKALNMSGAAANTQRGVMLQLSQAIGTDIVRAEEFNSILEGGIRIAQAAADGIAGFEGNVAKLRKAVVDGEITSKQFFDAILSQVPKINKEWSRTNSTISQAFTQLNNSMVQFVGGLDKATGASQMFISLISGLASNFNAVFNSIVLVAGAYGLVKLTTMTYAFIKAVGSLNIALALTGKSLKVFALTNPYVLGITALAGAFFLLKERTTESEERTKDNIKTLEDLRKQIISNRIVTEAVAKEEKAELEVKLARIEADKKILEMQIESNRKLDESKGFFKGLSSIVSAGTYHMTEWVTGLVTGAETSADKAERLNEVNKSLAGTTDLLAKAEERIEEGRRYDATVKAKEKLQLQLSVIEALEEEYNLTSMTAEQQAVYKQLKEAGYEYTKKDITANGELLNIYDKNALKIAELAAGQVKLKQEMKESKDEAKSFLEAFSGKDSPIENWIKDANNLGDALSNTLVGALNSTEDAIIDFAQTGKFSFSDLASSVIEDLSRMMIRASLAQAVMGFMGGGSGFSIPGFANGGPVYGAGTGTSDSIPAMLSNGEYVVNAKATSQFRPLLESINSMPKYAKGGLVGSASSSGYSIGSSNVDIQVIDQRGTNAPPVETETQTNSDGSKMIRMLIHAEVKKGISNGTYDSSMSSSYGVKRSTTRR